MQHESLQELLARIAENHRRAHALLEDAQAAVQHAAETLSDIARQRQRDPLTAVADLRQVAQRGRAVVEDRLELLERLAELTGRAP